MNKIIIFFCQYLCLFYQKRQHNVISLSGYISLLKKTSFVRLVSANIISLIGSRITFFALLKKVYEISAGNIVDLGFISILSAIPHIVFGPVAGAISDRLSRRLIIVIADTINGILMLSLIFIDSLSAIKLVAFFASSCYAFSSTAQKALEPNLVSKTELALLNSFKSFSYSLVFIAGSALGGAIVGFSGVNVSFLVDAVTFFLSAILVLGIRCDEEHQHSINKEATPFSLIHMLVSFVGDIESGIAMIKNNSYLRYLMYFEMSIAFLYSLEGTLLYPFVRETFKAVDKSEFAFGGLLTADGVGLMIGSIFFGVVVKNTKNSINVMNNSIIICEMLYLVFIYSKIYLLSLVLFLVIGFLSAPIAIVIDTLKQEHSDDNNRGKIISIIDMLSNPMSMLSVFVGAILAKYITVNEVLMFFTVLKLLMVLYARTTNCYKNIRQTAKKTTVNHDQIALLDKT